MQQSVNARPRDVLHVVEIVDQSAPTHFADWRLFDTPNGVGRQKLEELIRAYWQDSPNSGGEVLVDGPIRVLGKA